MPSGNKGLRLFRVTVMLEYSSIPETLEDR
jgi:hypothetical protein